MGSLSDAIGDSLGAAADMVGLDVPCDCVCPSCRLATHCNGFYCSEMVT